MNGSNGKTYAPISAAVLGQDGPDTTQQDNPPPAQVTNGAGRNIGLDLLPFTPVPFTGNDAIWAYIRVGLYGAMAMATWKRARTVSYVMSGAAAVSVLTSLSASARNGGRQ